MKLQWVGQIEVPAVACDPCKFWEQRTGGLGCECAPDPFKIGGAAVLGVAALWLIYQSVPQLRRSNPPARLLPLRGRALGDFNQYADEVEVEYKNLGGRSLQPYKINEFYSLGVPPKEAARAIKTRKGPAEQRRREAFG